MVEVKDFFENLGKKGRKVWDKFKGIPKKTYEIVEDDEDRKKDLYFYKDEGEDEAKKWAKDFVGAIVNGNTYVSLSKNYILPPLQRENFSEEDFKEVMFYESVIGYSFWLQKKGHCGYIEAMKFIREAEDKVSVNGININDADDIKKTLFDLLKKIRREDLIGVVEKDFSNPNSISREGHKRFIKLLRKH